MTEVKIPGISWTRKKEDLCTVHVVFGGQLDDNLMVLVAEAYAIHVCAIVVPYLACFQLHTHLCTFKSSGLAVFFQPCLCEVHKCNTRRSRLPSWELTSLKIWNSHLVLLFGYDVVVSSHLPDKFKGAAIKASHNGVCRA